MQVLNFLRSSKGEKEAEARFGDEYKYGLTVAAPDYGAVA